MTDLPSSSSRCSWQPVGGDQGILLKLSISTPHFTLRNDPQVGATVRLAVGPRRPWETVEAPQFWAIWFSMPVAQVRSVAIEGKMHRGVIKGVHGNR